MSSKSEGKYLDFRIPNPEFRYIFTVDLKGRIIGEDESFQEIRETPQSLNGEGGSAHSGPKLKYEKHERDIDFSKMKHEIYYMLKMEESAVKHYIDFFLLKHSTPLRWLLNKKIAVRLFKTSLDRFQTEKTMGNSGSKEYKDFFKRLRKELDLDQDDKNALRMFSYEGKSDTHTSEDFRLAGIEVKLFRAGALSILLRLRWPGALTLEDCLQFIRYPENIVIKKEEFNLGPLNSFALVLAEEVLEDFCVSPAFNDVRDLIKKHFRPLGKKVLDFSKLSIAEEKADGTGFKTNVYVGVFLSEMREANSGKNVEKADNPAILNSSMRLTWKKTEVQRALIALANTTPEFAQDFVDEDEYIKKKNIARGTEVIMLERRSWIIASDRLRGKESTRYKVGIVECLLYSLEAIIATTSAIETFNEDLEVRAKPPSRKFNEDISDAFKKSSTKKDVGGFLKRENMNEFIEVISDARAISPCEDIITSMEAHLRSATSIKAIAAMKEALELDSLISLARERMRNYGYFLETGHHIVMSEEQQLISSRIEKETWWIQILTIGGLIVTSIMTIFTILIYLKYR